MNTTVSRTDTTETTSPTSSTTPGTTTARSRIRVLRAAPPAAALTVAFALQVVAITDTVGGTLADTGTDPRVWYLLAGLLGVAVATSIEAGAAYLMALYDRHLPARDSVWQLRLGMICYVGLSAAMIHWWLGTRGLPQIVAWVLAGMSASALWLWSRGSRWAQRQDMIEAGQIDPALPRLPTVSKVLHPVRWVITVWLISWEPVTTTAEARARYQQWATTRRFLPRRNPSACVSGAEPVLATPSGTATDLTVPRCGDSMVAKSTNGSVPARTLGNGPRGRSDADLIRLIRRMAWQDASLNFLAAQLHVSKRRATRLRRQASAASPVPGAPDHVV